MSKGLSEERAVSRASGIMNEDVGWKIKEVLYTIERQFIT